MSTFWKGLIRRNDRIFEWIARNPLAFLLGLALLGSVTRFIYLGSASFYLDEAFSVFHGQKRLGMLLESVASDTNPPLHFILLKYWMELTGKTEVSTRLLSALFSLMSIPMIFVLGRRFFSLRVGVFAALLFTLSDIHVVYSQEARTYTLVSFLALISLYYFFALCETGRWKDAVGLGIANTLLVYAHYGVYILFLTEFFGVFLLAGRRWPVLRAYVLSQVGAALLFVPWLPYWSMHFKIPSTWASPPDGNMFYWVLLRFAGVPSTLILWEFVLSIALVIGVVHLFQKKLEQPGRWIFLWMMSGLGIILAFILSNFVLPIFQPNYLMYMTIGFILLFAWAWDSLPVLKNISAFSAIILSVFLMQELHYNYGKPFAWRSQIATLKLYDKPGTLKVYPYNFNEPPFAYYYDRNAFINYRHTTSMLHEQHAFGVNSVEELKGLGLNQYDRVLFSTLRTDDPALISALRLELEKNYGKAEVYGDWEMQVELYERDTLKEEL